MPQFFCERRDFGWLQRSTWVVVDFGALQRIHNDRWAGDCVEPDYAPRRVNPAIFSRIELLPLTAKRAATLVASSSVPLLDYACRKAGTISVLAA